MSDFKHIIEPERMGLWVAASFVLALFALVVAIVAIHRNTELAVAVSYTHLTLPTNREV